MTVHDGPWLSMTVHDCCWLGLWGTICTFPVLHTKISCSCFVLSLLWLLPLSHNSGLHIVYSKWESVGKCSGEKQTEKKKLHCRTAGLFVLAETQAEALSLTADQNLVLTWALKAKLYVRNHICRRLKLWWTGKNVLTHKKTQKMLSIKSETPFMLVLTKNTHTTLFADHTHQLICKMYL